MVIHYSQTAPAPPAAPDAIVANGLVANVGGRRLFVVIQEDARCAPGRSVSRVVYSFKRHIHVILIVLTQLFTALLQGMQHAAALRSQEQLGPYLTDP